MVSDLDGEHQVTGGSSAVAGAAFSAQPDALPVVHTGGDTRGERAAFHGESHLGAERGVAEGQPCTGGDILATGMGTVPGAREAAAETGAATARESATTATEHGQQVLEVRTARALGTATRAKTHVAALAAEHRAEDVLEAGAPGAASSGCEARATSPHGANRVVLLALLGVVQHAVGLADLLQLLLRGLVTGVAVRVELAGLLAVGLLDLLRARIARDAEDLVEVLIQPFLLGHVCVSFRERRMCLCSGAGPARCGGRDLQWSASRNQAGPRVPTRAGRSTLSCIR